MGMAQCSDSWHALSVWMWDASISTFSRPIPGASPNGYFGLGATASSLTPSLRAVIQMSNGLIALPDSNLACSLSGTLEFTRYVDELKCIQHFTLLNREKMMERVIRPLSWWMGVAVVEKDRINWSPKLRSEGDSFR